MTVPPGFARTPEAPFFAVIFTAQRTPGDNGYEKMAQRIAELAKGQPGYLGLEGTKDAGGFEITISYWESEECIRDWKAHLDHQIAQKQGRKLWYEHYEIRIAKVERAYNMLTSKL